MYTQPELQPKRLGQEETLMAGYFFRTEERHESTDIKSKTHRNSRAKILRSLNSLEIINSVGKDR